MSTSSDTPGGLLRGKVALITAAGRGMGRAAAELFAREGAEVWATDIDVGALADLGGCRVRALDVCDPEAIRTVMEEAGPLDILFNCAGVVAGGTILDCDEAQWARLHEVNVTGMYRTIRQALPAMIAARRGSIINMSSVASSIKGVPNRFAYGTTKAAVIGLTKAIAADFISHGIRCNAICPGTIDTPSLHERLRATGDYDSALAAFTARQPMGRLGRAEEVAALALYLASDQSSFTTGQIHIIDGGWTV